MNIPGITPSGLGAGSLSSIEALREALGAPARIPVNGVVSPAGIGPTGREPVPASSLAAVALERWKVAAAAAEGAYINFVVQSQTGRRTRAEIAALEADVARLRAAADAARTQFETIQNAAIDAQLAEAVRAKAEAEAAAAAGAVTAKAEAARRATEAERQAIAAQAEATRRAAGIAMAAPIASSTTSPPSSNILRQGILVAALTAPAWLTFLILRK